MGKGLEFIYELTFPGDQISELPAKLNHLGVEYKLFRRSEDAVITDSGYSHMLLGTAQPQSYAHGAPYPGAYPSNLYQNGASLVVVAVKTEENMNFIRLALGGAIDAYKRLT
jgi:hypothetical protein